MDFTQCTRKRKDGKKFCGSHKKNLPNGMIGDDGACFNRTKKQRGRKPKNYLKKNNEDEFPTTKIQINGEQYLIDEHNILYSFRDENNEIYTIISGIYKDGKICNL